ncbi:MAG: hypothetical protein Q9210_002877, partial [Variospora velana]
NQHVSNYYADPPGSPDVPDSNHPPHATGEMGSNAPYGQRLLARVIDDYAAKQPDRAWVTVSRSDDLTQGFIDITFRRFAKAIDRTAFWLEDRLGASHGSFETFVYAGDKDIRYPIMAVAAVKVGRKVRH